MKVLMLGWELPPHNSGGLGVACYNMAKSLARKGIDIDFVVPYLAEHPKIDFMNILNATTLDPIFRHGGGPYTREILTPLEGVSLPTSETISIRDIQEIYCNYVDVYLEENDPSCVHAHDWLTFEAGMLAKNRYGVPLVAHVHATEYDRSGMNGGNKLIHEIEHEGLVMADKIFAVSNATKNIIHEKYGIPLEKIDIAYNSLDEDFQNTPYNYNSSDVAYLEKKKSEGYTIISTVGRFTIQKGLYHFMRAARLALKENPKLLFVFAGDGEERNELLALAASYGISKNVVFTGFIRGKELRDIYSVSDVFVMSSVSEPFGLTALEAAYFGDILILTKQSGVSEVLKSAIKYDFWDEQKLADEILAVSGSKALRDTLRSHVKREYLKISWDDIADEIIKVYNKLGKHKE